MKIKIKKLHPNAVIPSYAKPGDAGMDLTATSAERASDNTLKWVVKFGIAMEIPEGYVGLIFPRSSIHKTRCRLSNCVGVIDSGYRGEISAVFDVPHPHATLIKAWADGATIQYKDLFGVWWDADIPAWKITGEYRIKPSNEPEAAAERVKDALKVENGDKVMSREEADSAMRSAIGICAIIDKNTSLLRENNKLKEELESFITRCEYLQKAKEQLIASHAAVDGVTLTNGEISLIRAIRRSRICRFYEDFVVAEKHENGVATHRPSLAFFTQYPCDDTEIKTAIQQIQKEQEANHD